MSQNIAPRLQLIDPATAPKATAETFETLPTINLFRAMANAESLYPAYMKYIYLLFKPLELPSGLERMIVLYVSQLSGCEYAWRQNVVIAQSVHVTQDQIDALERQDIAASCFSDREKVALQFSKEAVELIEVTEPTYVQTKALYSDRAITEILYVVGTYMFVARIARTGRVPLDTKPAEASSIK